MGLSLSIEIGGTVRRSHVFLAVVMTAIVSLLVAGYVWQKSQPPSKVATAEKFLTAVGFSDPQYLGLTQGTEGEYPTFRVKALSGESVDLWIRTVIGGGMEIQPVGSMYIISSAYDFSGLAEEAVYHWYTVSESPQAYSSEEYDGALQQYEIFKDYVFPEELKSLPWPSEIEGWPAK